MKKFLPWLALALILILSGLLIFKIYFEKENSVTGAADTELERIRPRNMRITEVGKDYFIVEWRTSTSTTGFIQYGDTSSTVNLIAQDISGTNSTKSHAVRVSGLVEGRKYYFWVMSDNIAFGKDGRALEVLTLGEE